MSLCYLPCCRFSLTHIYGLVDEHDNDVPVGQPGEALLKGPVVSQGYHNNSEANAIGFTQDGWYRTGDVMQFEEGGDLLYVVGRTKVRHGYLSSTRN